MSLGGIEKDQRHETFIIYLEASQETFKWCELKTGMNFLKILGIISNTKWLGYEYCWGSEVVILNIHFSIILFKVRETYLSENFLVILFTFFHANS